MDILAKHFSGAVKDNEVIGPSVTSATTPSQRYNPYGVNQPLPAAQTQSSTTSTSTTARRAPSIVESADKYCEINRNFRLAPEQKDVLTQAVKSNRLAAVKAWAVGKGPNDAPVEVDLEFMIEFAQNSRKNYDFFDSEEEAKKKAESKKVKKKTPQETAKNNFKRKPADDYYVKYSTGFVQVTLENFDELWRNQIIGPNQTYINSETMKKRRKDLFEKESKAAQAAEKKRAEIKRIQEKKEGWIGKYYAKDDEIKQVTAENYESLRTVLAQRTPLTKDQAEKKAEENRKKAGRQAKLKADWTEKWFVNKNNEVKQVTTENFEELKSQIQNRTPLTQEEANTQAENKVSKQNAAQENAAKALKSKQLDIFRRIRAGNYQQYKKYEGTPLIAVTFEDNETEELPKRLQQARDALIRAEEQKKAAIFSLARAKLKKDIKNFENIDFISNVIDSKFLTDIQQSEIRLLKNEAPVENEIENATKRYNAADTIYKDIEKTKITLQKKVEKMNADMRKERDETKQKKKDDELARKEEKERVENLVNEVKGLGVIQNTFEFKGTGTQSLQTKLCTKWQKGTVYRDFIEYGAKDDYKIEEINEEKMKQQAFECFSDDSGTVEAEYKQVKGEKKVIQQGKLKYEGDKMFFSFYKSQADPTKKRELLRIPIKNDNFEKLSLGDEAKTNNLLYGLFFNRRRKVDKDISTKYFVAKEETQIKWIGVLYTTTKAGSFMMIQRKQYGAEVEGQYYFDANNSSNIKKLLFGEDSMEERLDNIRGKCDKKRKRQINTATTPANATTETTTADRMVIGASILAGVF